MTRKTIPLHIKQDAVDDYRNTRSTAIEICKKYNICRATLFNAMKELNEIQTHKKQYGGSGNNKKIISDKDIINAADELRRKCDQAKRL